MAIILASTIRAAEIEYEIAHNRYVRCMKGKVVENDDEEVITLDQAKLEMDAAYDRFNDLLKRKFSEVE